MRAYADELKGSSQTRESPPSCKLPDEVAGHIQMLGCEKTFLFRTMSGTNTKCVRNGATRTNGSFSGIATAEECANKCVENEAKANYVVGMNFNCDAQVCQW